MTLPAPDHRLPGPRLVHAPRDEHKTQCGYDIAMPGIVVGPDVTCRVCRGLSPWGEAKEET